MSVLKLNTLCQLKGYQSSWGLCKSGQSIDGLLKEISNIKGEKKPSVIVMIGTNDVLKITKGKGKLARERNTLKHKIIQLKNKLGRKCGTVYWCSIPPIPLLERTLDEEKKRRYRGVLDTVNTTVSSFEGDQFKVIPVGESFFDKEGDAVHHYFERSMGVGRSKRDDLIHWNGEGMEIAGRTLNIYLKNVK